MRHAPCRAAAVLLAALIASLAASTGCGRDGPRGRVLLIGVDGATLRVIEPMMAAGRLPHLARIADRGTHGVMRSYHPFLSPRVWTTVATGKSPERHGITGFKVPLEGGGKRLVTSADRRGHALWNIASDRGLEVATVNWWVTHPPERIRGVVVSDHFLPAVVAGRERMFGTRAGPAAPSVHPADWQARVGEIVRAREAEDDLRGPFADVPLPPWARHEKLSEWYRDDASVGALALAIEQAMRPDLMLVLLKGVDAASHVLFATVVPEAELPAPLPASEDERAAGARALERFYAQADAIIGRLVEHHDEDDLVLVVSDHGFEPRRRYTDLTGSHRSAAAGEAVVFARGAGIAPGAAVEDFDVLDVTPTILAWLGLPVADDMDGRPATFLDAAAPDRIASYDTRAIERVGGRDAGVEERILEQLEALGYFEGDGEATATE